MFLKVYCSFDENNVLTGWSINQNSFSTTETFREIELTEDEFNELENTFIGCFKFENGTLVCKKQEFFDELKLLKMEELAVEEEKRAEELATSLSRLNL